MDDKQKALLAEVQDGERALLRVDLTPEQCAALSGTYMLHLWQHSPPRSMGNILRAASEVPMWTLYSHIGSPTDETDPEFYGVPELMSQLQNFAVEHIAS